MSIFEKLGHDLGYEASTGWLYDMYWCTEKQGEQNKFLTRIPMALESEFNKRHPDLDGDFQKLVQARAAVRVWVTTCSNARKHIDYCKQQIQQFAETLSRVQYVFAIYDQNTKQPLIEKYIAP
jgi:hypothetical protein